jgi:hypothetical protein
MLKKTLITIAVVVMLAVMVSAEEPWPMSFDEKKMGEIPVKLHVVRWARVTWNEDHLNVEQIGNGEYQGCMPIWLCNNFVNLNLIARIHQAGPVMAEEFWVSIGRPVAQCDQLIYFEGEATQFVGQLHLTGNEQEYNLGALIKGVDMQSTPFLNERKTQVALIELFVLPL